jgi:hypothetical protein
MIGSCLIAEHFTDNSEGLSTASADYALLGDSAAGWLACGVGFR